MKSETARRIAKANGKDEIQKWHAGISKFVAEATPHVILTATSVCNGCPFRNNNDCGCIGEECPVHAVRKMLNLTMKRLASSMKSIYKSQYAARVAAWAKS